MIKADHIPLEAYLARAPRPVPRIIREQDPQVIASRDRLWRRIRLAAVQTDPARPTAQTPTRQDIPVLEFYYNVAQAMDDPDLPSLLRSAPISSIGGSIVSRAGKSPLCYPGEDLLKAYQNPRIKDDLYELFRKYGYDPVKIDRFIAARGEVESVYIYFDGFIVMPDLTDRRVYILYINKWMAKELVSPSTYD
jgi:hypothetical protein